MLWALNIQAPHTHTLYEKMADTCLTFNLSFTQGGGEVGGGAGKVESETRKKMGTRAAPLAAAVVT